MSGKLLPHKNSVHCCFQPSWHLKYVLQLQSIQIQTSCSTQPQEITPLTLYWCPQIPVTCCHLLSSCWIPACTTPTSGTSPPWSDLSPWTEASMREEICQRNFSGWGLDYHEPVWVMTSESQRPLTSLSVYLLFVFFLSRRTFTTASKMSPSKSQRMMETIWRTHSSILTEKAGF